VNGKSYIGSSEHLARRFAEYINPNYLEREIEKNRSRIYRALLKYGYSNFKLEILDYCKTEECLSKEQECLDHLEHEYNILPIAGSRSGSTHSEDTKAKMSEAARKV
jgi:group I intron endonuclease